MKLQKSSLRIRIFLSMIFLVVFTSILIVGVTVYQYKKRIVDYNAGRLERKEKAVKSSIEYWFKTGNTYPLESKNLSYIFKDKIFEISDIEKLDIHVYDLKGKLAISSHAGFVETTAPKKLKDSLVLQLQNSPANRIVISKMIKESTFQSSYFFITDNKYKPIGILNVQYVQDNSEQTAELQEALIRMTVVYGGMFLIAIILAYFISSYITRSIKVISDKMTHIKLNKTNEKIVLEDASTEIHTLVESYNEMVEALEESAIKLAQGEREVAWREMAKQVAHEVKNPLTPMRLTVQSFQRNFNPKSPDSKEQINEFCKTLVTQIDTMSSIASAFSNFAQMPVQKTEKLNVVEVVKFALDIFSEEYISYTHSDPEIIAELDKTQLVRVVTNLVKNSIQALRGRGNKRIDVNVSKSENKVVISVKDNGKGVSKSDKHKIFEPKFTTKSSGMGLGLPMIKNIVEAYKGSIEFNSEEHVGTEFKIILPI